VVVVIDEAGIGIVVATSEHAGGGLLLLDCRDGSVQLCYGWSWARTWRSGHGGYVHSFT
jgi:hypothetical protein